MLSGLALLAAAGAGGVDPRVPDILGHLAKAIRRPEIAKGRFPADRANIALLGVATGTKERASDRVWIYDLRDRAGEIVYQVLLNCSGIKRCGAFNVTITPVNARIDLSGIQHAFGRRLLSVPMPVADAPTISPFGYISRGGRKKPTVEVRIYTSETVQSVTVWTG